MFPSLAKNTTVFGGSRQPLSSLLTSGLTSEKTLNTGYKQEEVMYKPTRYKPAQVASKIKLTTART